MPTKPNSSLQLDSITIRTAPLGPPNPLPPLRSQRYIADEVAIDESVPESARQHLNYGCDAPVLPYDELNDYGRVRQDVEFRTVVLENEYLRATFLPDLGGRLWSLVHKPSGRELLYVNRVFQPTNQAVRNAWFSGGVEWNVSLRGHCPFTCSSLFAQEHQMPDGTPLLRMFEFERVRRVPFALDCWLPANSKFLFVKPHLWNPHEQTIPMYWWSNIAVPQTEGTRVLVPTDHTYRYAYRDELTRIPIPQIDGVDASYATNLTQSADYFFDIPEGRRPWIAAVDQQGHGLIQTSTLRQRGRKMFVWGTGQGGARWQQFLTEEGGTYLEIQAGIAQTQYECLPMPSGEHWTWVEAYGPLETETDQVHSKDWSVAIDHVNKQLEQDLPLETLDTKLGDAGIPFEASPNRWLNQPSGWGALEMQVRLHESTEGPECPGFTLFPPDSIGPESRRWLDLLTSNTFPSADVSEPPSSWLVGPDWRQRLVAAVEEPSNSHWLTWWHLGIMAYHAGDRTAAATAWQKSLACEPNAWAYRNLAVVATDEGNTLLACDQLASAHELLPTQACIAVEYASALLAAGHAQQLLDWHRRLPSLIADSPRLRLRQAEAQLAVGNLDAVESFLSSDFELPDLREGDSVLTDLWQKLTVLRHLREAGPSECPPHIDFRMGCVGN